MRSRKPTDKLAELEKTVQEMLREADVDFESVKCYRESIHIHLTDGAPHQNIESLIPAILDGKPTMLFINGSALKRATDRDLFGDCQATLADNSKNKYSLLTITGRIGLVVIILTAAAAIAAAYLYREPIQTFLLYLLHRLGYFQNENSLSFSHLAYPLSSARWLLPATLFVLVNYLTFKFTYWYKEGQILRTPGHLTPRISLPARFTRAALLKLLSSLFVGKVTISGHEQIPSGTRQIVVANHQTEKDTLLMGNLLGTRNYRYMIAKYQTAGWRAPLAAWTGAIIVDFKSEEGGSIALKTSKRMMERADELDTDFLIFPQGNLHPDNIITRDQFRPGAALLALHAASLGQEVSILPVGIKYIRDPAAMTWFHRVLSVAGLDDARRFFGDLTYGANLTVGKHLSISAENSAEEITERIYVAIKGLIN
ncbi:MAG: 1-acyl-sn-glycerol-3-phosphate acyltransferase [Candidatus Obscuribacterales bacterium]|nr:1-acyl-sn-glycerol-3-phosphate acyltransferase [Cyanobacteria bacterium HKST-UBA01]MCB9466740.1 1-acyl-sn-glycerol-3-phosphate acyltransferase [Candidatus Obscuribacterales bacterium]